MQIADSAGLNPQVRAGLLPQRQLLSSLANGALSSEQKNSALLGKPNRPLASNAGMASNRNLIGVAFTEDKSEMSAEKVELLKKEYAKEISALIRKEENQVILKYEELNMMKELFVAKMDKTPFLTRNQFMEMFMELTSCQSKQFADMNFLWAIRKRPKILGPKNPFNSISFVEFVSIMENLSKFHPLRVLKRIFFPIY